MRVCDLGDIRLHYRDEGDPGGAALVLAHGLGADLRIWDGLVARLPGGLRILRYDLRGHGLSDAPAGPYGMGALVRDAERLLDALAVRDCVFVGLGLGGMVAQGLAVKRLDQMRGMVLSNTAARIGTAQHWQDRAALVRAQGLEPLADPIMERWFSRSFRATPELARWRNMLLRTPAEGYAGCCAALAGTDFYTTTAGLGLPTLAIAGTEDRDTPPDLVRETTDLVKGSRFALIHGGGHLPCVDRPADYAAVLMGFLQETGHI